MSDVDSYLEGAPEPHRTTLTEVRDMLLSLVPDAEEGMSYGVPAVTVGGTPIAGYAYFANHCGYYPHSGDVLSSIDPELLAGYDWSAGTLRFPPDAAPPRSLIEQLVTVRIAELDA